MEELESRLAILEHRLDTLNPESHAHEIQDD